MFSLDRISDYAMSNDLVVRYLPERHTDENDGKVGLLLVKESYRNYLKNYNRT